MDSTRNTTSSRYHSQSDFESPAKRYRNSNYNSSTTDLSPPQIFSDQNSNDQTSDILLLVLKETIHSDTYWAKHWINWYSDDQYAALIALLQLITTTGGSDYVFDKLNDKKEIERRLPIIIQRMQTSEVNMSKYLLSKPDFYRRYCNFFKKIVYFSNDSLYDKLWIEMVLLFLKEFNRSENPMLNYCSIISALHLCTGFIKLKNDIENNMRLNISRLEDQLKLEEDLQDQNLILQLRKFNEENESRDSALDSFMETVTKNIIKCYRQSANDDLFEIVVKEHFRWLNKRPKYFLNDFFWKCLLSGLFYKRKKIREEILRFLIQNYNENNRDYLYEFTRTYINVFVKVSNHDVPSVCRLALLLLTQILLLYENIFSEYDIKDITGSVFSVCTKCAKVAGTFVLLYIRKYPECEENSMANGLITFYKTHKSPKYDVAFVLESLWNNFDFDITKEFLDLLNKFTQKVLPSSPEREEILLEYLCAYLQRLKFYESQHDNDNLDNISKFTATTNLNNVTVLIINILPNAILNYAKQHKSLTLLFKLLRYLNIEIFKLENTIEIFNNVILLMTEHFDEDNERSVLEAYCKTIHDLFDKMQTLFPIILDVYLAGKAKWETEFDKSVIRIITFHNTEAEDSEIIENSTDLEISFRKKCLLVTYKTTPYENDIFDDVMEILCIRLEGRNYGLSDLFWKDCLLICNFHILWKFNELKENQNQADETEISTLVTNLASFMTLLYQLISYEDISDMLKYLAASQVMELLSIFSETNISHHIENINILKSIIWTNTTENNELLWNCIDELIFAKEPLLDIEIEYIELYKRQKILNKYFRLFLDSVVPRTYFIHMLKYLAKFENEFEKLINYMMVHYKMVSTFEPNRKLPIHGDTIIHALIERYEDVTPEDAAEYDAVTFKEVLRLASLLFKIFTSTNSVNTAAIRVIHTIGIEYANQGTIEDQVPPNLKFLEVLSKCSSKLDGNLKIIVMSKLKETFACTDSNNLDSEWRSLDIYRKTLGFRTSSNKKSYNYYG